MQVHLQKLCWNYVEWVRYCTGFFSDSNKSWIHLTDGCARLHCIMPRQCSGKVVAKEVSTVWEICGIFVEQSQSFHQFAARWRNRRKSGNLSTKKPSLQTVEWVNGTGRWIALAALTHIASDVEPDVSTPRCFTSFTAEAVISSTSQIKNAPLTRCVVFLRWWWEMDSNHRTRREQIYSLPPLTARQSHQNVLERVRGVEPL